MDLMYFPGTRWPFAAPDDILPVRLAMYPTGVPVMQDVVFLTLGTWGVSETFLANHVPGPGRTHQPLPANNPSWASHASNDMPEGANVAMADGSARWHDGSARWHDGREFEDVGRAEVHAADHHLLSLPPPQ